jgi:glycosyltransferase involved in cell wall biosynthesis
MSEKNKIKVLVLSSDNDGVGYFRVLNPHLHLNNHPEYGIECDIRLLSDPTIPLLDENFIKRYNIIFYNKVLPLRDDIKPMFFGLLVKYDIKLVYDIDDYWILNSTHLNYKQWKANNSSKIVEDNIRSVDHIITTTPIFSKRISELNPNISVIENGVNLKEKQWKSDKTQSEKIRFIWGGGISHIPDLRLLKDDFKLFDKDFLSKTQMYMCGYDLRIRTKEGIKMDNPNRSQWTHFESIFTNSGKYITDNEYKKYLMEYKQDNVTYGVNDKFKDNWYQRRITKPILLYGTMYNEADIGLAPLKGEGHQFNMMKSQLKVIEAGAHHMPLIASNYGPYTIDDIEGKNDKKQKGWLINEPSKGQWYEKMKWYVDNPNAIKEHGENLYEYVKNNYSLEVLTKKRAEIYKEILK